MKSLSIVYITLNAEAHLAESLAQSRQLTDDLVVVDSGSADRTLEIAHGAGCRVVHQDWLGFSAQKQLAINLAKNDWVLFLDADEILTQPAVEEIRALLSTKLSTDYPFTAFSLPRENWFQDKWIRHGGWWPDRVVRLVNRTAGQMKPVPIHECWIADGEVGELQAPLRHYSFQNYSQLIHKADKYSALTSQHLFAQGKRCSTWSPLTHASAAFLRAFVLKRGFLDGVEGAAIAFTGALGSFMKYAKLQELWRGK